MRSDRAKPEPVQKIMPIGIMPIGIIVQRVRGRGYRPEAGSGAGGSGRQSVRSAYAVP